MIWATEGTILCSITAGAGVIWEIAVVTGDAMVDCGPIKEKGTAYTIGSSAIIWGCYWT